MGTKPYDILIVEDEEGIRINLAAFLDDEGFNSIGVGTGEEALELVKSGQHFDLAIVDLRMPGMDGDEFIIKAAEVNPSLKYIIYTGSLEYILTKRLLALNLTKDNNLIFKPSIDMSEITRAIYANLEPDK